MNDDNVVNLRETVDPDKMMEMAKGKFKSLVLIGLTGDEEAPIDIRADSSLSAQESYFLVSEGMHVLSSINGEAIRSKHEAE